ncbi:MAG TPA: sigma-70 family RNA polymerase sigma factor [Anaeromyxobacteraceae bacterium]|nr:sigma-70 family RNA polymerase sigma factor [Anaeromyxobacteraceae bacterium]
MAEPRTARREADDAEAALLARLRAGDRAAFAALVGRHAGSLLRVAMSLLRDRAVAEEVVQETWLGLLTGLETFEGRSSLRTWLFQILVNRARSRFAREGRTVPFSALAGPGDDPPAVDPGRFDEQGRWREPPGHWTEADPERLAMGAETRAAIEAAIQELPEAQRAVITLRDIEGLETEEICNLLSITVTNQRVLLHRARAKVRQALERRLGGAR